MSPASRLSPLLVRYPWRVLLLSLCVAVVVTAAWLGVRLYTGGERYRQVPPGQAVTSPTGAEFTLQELYATGRVTDSDGEELEDLVPPAGVVYVVARMQVEAAAVTDPEFFCSLTLVGADDMLWETAFVYVTRDDEGFCTAGTSQVIEKLFAVPETEVDRIAGVALTTNGTGRVRPLLLAPRG